MEMDVFFVGLMTKFLWSDCLLSDEYDAEVRWRDIPDPPVVQIVMEKSIADTKLELSEVLLVFHDIECVKDVKSESFGLDKQVMQAVPHAVRRADIVVGVGHLQSLMLRVIQDLTGQVVEGEHVGEWLTRRSTIHVAVDDLVARHEEVAHLLLVEADVDLALCQVVVQEHGHLRYILLLHLSQARDRLLRRQMVPSHVISHGGLGGLVAESHINKLLRVQATVPVGSTGEGCRDRRA